MARIRSIHPGIWTDEDFVEMSPVARLFLFGLWNEADDYGVLEWRPTKLKMRLAPADTINAAALMDEIHAAGFIVRIEREGKTYAVIKNFRKWQRPKNPSAPLITVDAEIENIVCMPQGDRATPAVPPEGVSGPGKSAQREEGGDNRDEEEEGEKGGGERASAQGRPPRKTPLEFDWKADAATVERCAGLGLSNEEIVAQSVVFGTWHRSRGEERADWQEAFVVWCQREATKLGRKPGKPAESVPTVYIRQLDPAWPAYVAAHKSRHGKDPPTDRAGGWHFPLDLLPAHATH